MIIEVLTKMLIGFVISFLSGLPTANYMIPTGFLDIFYDIVLMVDYFLPLRVLFPLLSISIGLDLIHISWKIILRFKSFVPTLGD